MVSENDAICSDVASARNDCEQPTQPDACLSNDEAARYIGVSPKTLPDWRVDGRSPPWIKAGRRVVYRRVDLDRWLSERVCNRMS